MILIRLVLILSVLSLSGCLESRFELAEQSRLPKWFLYGEEGARDEFRVKVEFHSNVGTEGGSMVVKLYRADDLRPLESHTIRSEDQPSIFATDLKTPATEYPKAYPAFAVAKINGKVDVLEFRKMEPIFYMNSDPLVWRELEKLGYLDSAEL